MKITLQNYKERSTKNNHLFAMNHNNIHIVFTIQHVCSSPVVLDIS